MPSVVVYPPWDSFDNGVIKGTGGLCGSYKSDCKLYFGDGVCINDAKDTRIKNEFKTFWRYKYH